MEILRGFDFEGGHDESKGLDESGRVILVPLHRHEVSLDYSRVELEGRYTVARSWDVSLRVPWDEKEQSVRVVIPGAASPGEREAILRNADIHHRSETYEGFSDLTLRVQRRGYGVWRSGDAWSFAAGTTIPTGRTEENPYRLGAMGREHLHIQFGSGTFDPLVELSYFSPAGDRLFGSGYLAARVPLGENDRGYSAPPEVSATVGVGLRLSRVRIRGEMTAFRQGYGTWDGVRDPNTGLEAISGALGVSTRLQTSAIVDISVRLPIAQRALGTGDAFEQGPTVSLVTIVKR